MTVVEGGIGGTGAVSTCSGTVEPAPLFVLAQPWVITTEAMTATWTPTIKPATTDTLIFRLLRLFFKLFSNVRADYAPFVPWIQSFSMANFRNASPRSG